MAKTVDIPIEEWIAAIKIWFGGIQAWLINFFATIDTYETIAVGAIGAGLVMVIVGIILI